MTADRKARWSSPAPRMRGVSHAHTDHNSRAWHWFARGPVLAADGGERDVEPKRDRDVEDEQLRDVSHQAKHDPGANRVWERGESEQEEDET